MTPNHPNRGARTAASNPTPQAILEARVAALLAHSTTRRWQEWEAGVHRMHPGLFELFRLKVNQQTLMVTVPIYVDGRIKTLENMTRWDPQGFAELDAKIFPDANATTRHAVATLIKQGFPYCPPLYLPAAADRDRGSLVVDLSIHARVRMADAYAVMREMQAKP